MANRARGELALVAGERTYTLRLTTNACCELEDYAGGRTWDQVTAGINRGSLKDVRLLFWAALRDPHPELATDDPSSLTAIGTVIDEAGGIRVVLSRLRVLLQLNADRPPEGAGAAEPRPPDAPPAPTGPSSVSTH